ncbi:hypothetical protein BTJ40_07520 [Microbulbifer sp. A4B17]|uniref:hypothetical protein n=1 Tax=Microbulbifer sp. A4B17 TaxID=359370 RepID=UPI000D52AA34|nr:hypothetical protein [Microbulbifer sp. A4B17]AWF80675.1 hypothetical protein BTJ40_07520 [Microbulbifer sp. A4B17]
MKSLKYLLLSIPFTLPLISEAAWTEKAQIYYLKVHSNGVDVRLRGFVNPETEVSCVSKNTFFLINNDSAIYNTKVSFLLSAYMSQKTVKFSYYGCEDDRIRLGSIRFHDE